MKHFDAFAGIGGFTFALKNTFGNAVSVPVVEEIARRLKMNK